MRKVWRAIAGGIVSTFAMMSIFLVVDVQTRARLLLFEALARLFWMPDHVGLGFLIAVFFGVVVWPLVFVFLEPRLPPGDDPAVSGMLFATVLWVGFVLIGTSEITTLLFPFYLAVTLLTHLVYGFVLGLVYGWAPLASSRDAGAVGPAVDGGDG